MYKKYSKNVGNGSYLSTEFTVIACRSPYAVFLGRHSAREIHSFGTHFFSTRVKLLLMQNILTQSNLHGKIYL